MGKELYEVGELPPIGEVPAKMHAQLVRPDRFGEPEQAIQDEVLDVPELGPLDALVMVMAGGVNFNNVWAALGQPVSVFRYHDEDHHIGGSDASGIVWKVGEGVTRWAPGDEVVLHRTSHPIIAEAGGPAAISGAVLCPVDGPGGMFQRFPLFERLISWTHAGADADRGTREYELHDQNSLVADDPALGALVPGEIAEGHRDQGIGRRDD